MFELSATPLEAIDLKSRFADVRAGGYVTFEGWVRNRMSSGVNVATGTPSRSCTTVTSPSVCTNRSPRSASARTIHV